MKKLLYLLFAICLIGCSDDDSSDDSNSIEGRWNLVSTTDCGDPQEIIPCRLLNYMTFNNRLGEITAYNLIDEVPGTCQITDIDEVSYTVDPNSSNTYIILDNGEFHTASVNGKTLTIIDEFNASDTGCPQQDGVIIETTVFIRD